MAKVQNFSDLQQALPFTEYDFYHLYEVSFQMSELGRIKAKLPLHEMAEKFGLVDERPSDAREKRGRKPYFTPEGKVGLMFLKSYTGLSARKLMEALNGNIHYQLFCGICINPEKPLTNSKLINDIVQELAGSLRIQEQQKVLAAAWKPYMKDLDTVMTDATCYESWLRYPTDAKLLWECCEKAYEVMCEISAILGEHRMRTKYNDVERARMAYVKKRKHTHQQTRAIKRRMLALLDKILKEIRRQVRVHPNTELLTETQAKMMEVITKIYRQQKGHFESGDPKESIPNRIVSVNKPYVRPIVRGKEVKNVEFGAKCNNIQVDGLSFIQKLSFNAFNEGTELEHCISLSQRLFGVKVKKIGGDQIYAGNDNRTFCRENGIMTSFVQKGRMSKDEAKNEAKNESRRTLAKVRATAMEGSFGTQKNHYGLDRMVARLKSTEILLIFFGIHTANAVLLVRREAKLAKSQAQAA